MNGQSSLLPAGRTETTQLINCIVTMLPAVVNSDYTVTVPSRSPMEKEFFVYIPVKLCKKHHFHAKIKNDCLNIMNTSDFRNENCSILLKILMFSVSRGTSTFSFFFHTDLCCAR